jgi:hypothetical protein
MELDKLKGYLDQGLSLVKIGKLEGKSLGSIRHWMKVYDLKANFKNFKEEPYHKKATIIDGKRCCGRCKEWKDLSAFSTKGEGRHQHYCKVCHAAYTLGRWKNRKKKIVEMMGGKCSKCGYCRNYSALEFHHLDPSKKEINIANSIRRTWNSLIKELEKCVLVCSNCHREEHNPDMVFSGVLVESTPSLNWELKPTGTCPHCETKVFGTKYCSQLCAKSAKRRADRPSKEELARLIETTPFVQIGNKYGVSDNAIRKWANHYGLDWKAIKK